MAYEEFDGELDKPGEAPKGGYVEFEGELDKPEEAPKEKKTTVRSVLGMPDDPVRRDKRTVEPFVGGDVRQGPAGAGRGTVNPPQINEPLRPGESVLDRAALPPPSGTPEGQRDYAADSVAPREKARQARDLQYLRGTGVASETPLGQRLGDVTRRGLEAGLGTGGAAIAGGIVGGLAEIGKAGTGAVAAGADVVGASGLSEFAKAATRGGGGIQQAVMPQGEGIDKTVSEVFSSIASNAPTMALGVGGQGAALKLMFGQTALANYGELTSQGFQPLPSAAASVINSGAEVLGERFGFKEQTIAVKGLMDRMMRHGSSTDDMAKNMAKLLVKEVPGEELTATVQFINEKYGFAPRTPEATLTDYFKQLGETAIVTMGQSGVVGGTPAAIDARAKVYKQAEAAINASAGLLPKGPYRDAAEKGFVVDPPLVTDPPTTQRSKTVKIFENVAAESGVNAAAIKRAKEAADGMPAQDVGQFLNDVLQALQRKGGVATPISEHAAAALTAGAAVPLSPEESAKAKEALKPAAEQEEDLTGLSEETPPSALEAAAHEAASSPTNERPEPTAAQAEAGNYAKGHFKIDGLDLSIENPEGSVRKDMKNVPPKWENEMKAHYGYIRGTVGMDGDHIDTFIKPGTQGEHGGEVFVIDQLHADGTPDEAKVMIGYASEEEARAAYLAHYPKGWKGLGAITAAPIDQFKTWLKDGDTKKPFAPPPANEPAQPDVQPTPIAPSGATAAGGDQPAGSSRAVGLDADGPAGSGVQRPAAPAPAPSVRAPAPVGNRGDKPAPVGRVISNVGVTPATAAPLELRDNPDGSTTPWHGGHEVLDFESGDPLVIPAGTSDADALKIVKGARPFGRNSKYFAVASEEAAAPAPEKINTPPVAKAGHYTVSDAISADGPAKERVKLVVRDDGTAAIQRDNGDVIDVTNMVRSGFTAERAIAQSIGDDTTGKNVSTETATTPAIEPGDIVRVTTGPLKGTVRSVIRPASDGAPGWVVSDSSKGEQTVVGVSFVRKPTAAPAPVDKTPDQPGDKPAEMQASGEVPQPDTLAESLTALERGDRIVRFPGSEFEERVWIAEVKKTSGNTWVVKSKSADTNVTVTKGPVGPDKKWGWGKSDAARKAVEGWVFEGDQATTKAEEKPEVKAEPVAAPPVDTAPVSDVKAETPATLSDEKAFADDYAAFEGKTVEQPVQVEETGETLKMRMDAATALRELDKRRKALEALRACLEKA